MLLCCAGSGCNRSDDYYLKKEDFRRKKGKTIEQKVFFYEGESLYHFFESLLRKVQLKIEKSSESILKLKTNSEILRNILLSEANGKIKKPSYDDIKLSD